MELILERLQKAAEELVNSIEREALLRQPKVQALLRALSSEPSAPKKSTR